MRSLIDSYGRRVRKLRVSLTDRCNLRCHYCMPVDSKFMAEDKYLTNTMQLAIIKELIDFGLEEVRITGGEPLLRKDFSQLALGLKELPLKKIGLTTNGILLDRYIEVLNESKIKHINISLDSLEPKTFEKITYGKKLHQVLKNIELAKKSGLNIKINTVLMKGINDHEIEDFINFSKETEIEVRFLELMRIGHANSEQNKKYISAIDIINKIKSSHKLKQITQEYDSTSFNYILENGAQIGFIASESMPFCSNCSRWRLSADGILRACLLKDEGLSIKEMTKSEREEVYFKLLGMKPIQRPKEVNHYMNEIGG